DTTEIDSQYGDVMTVEKARAAQQRAVSAQRHQRVDLIRVVERRLLCSYFRNLLLEKRLDAEVGCDAKKRPENIRQLFVTFMSDDTEPHQTARSWAPRALSSPKACVARLAMPRAS